MHVYFLFRPISCSSMFCLDPAFLLALPKTESEEGWSHSKTAHWINQSLLDQHPVRCKDALSQHLDHLRPRNKFEAAQGGFLRNPWRVVHGWLAGSIYRSKKENPLKWITFHKNHCFFKLRFTCPPLTNRFLALPFFPPDTKRMGGLCLWKYRSTGQALQAKDPWGPDARAFFVAQNTAVCLVFCFVFSFCGFFIFFNNIYSHEAEMNFLNEVCNSPVHKLTQQILRKSWHVRWLQDRRSAPNEGELVLVGRWVGVPSSAGWGFSRCLEWRNVEK